MFSFAYINIYIYICSPHVCLVPVEVRKGYQILRTEMEAVRNCVHAGNPNPGPLLKLPVLLAASLPTSTAC